MLKRINVMQRDIDRANKARVSGNFENVAQCPVAFAATRAFGRKMHAGRNSVHSMRVHTSDSDYDDSCYLPVEASQFTEDFDHDRPVKPFHFDVECPDGKYEKPDVNVVWDGE